MKNKCKYLTETQHNELVQWLQKFEFFFNGTLVTWKKYPVDLELKEDTKPICSRPYPVWKLHAAIFQKEIERIVLLGVL